MISIWGIETTEYDVVVQGVSELPTKPIKECCEIPETVVFNVSEFAVDSATTVSTR